MNDNWKDTPSAPVEGAVICAASAVPEGGILSVELDGFPIMLVRSADRIVAFVNACPHQFLPLDYRSSSVLSADGCVLRCTNHEAGFDVVTGKGIDGFGTGCALDPVPVHVDGGGHVIVGNQ